jgi:hypothetical protein
MRMAGVEVIGRNPVELRSQVLLHLPHHVAGEGTQVCKPLAILWRDDEAELMAVLPPAFHKSLAIGFISLSAVEPARFAIATGTVAL